VNADLSLAHGDVLGDRAAVMSTAFGGCAPMPSLSSRPAT
jgi:hypothetical protein